MSNDMNEPEKLNFIKEKESFINKPVEPKKKKEKFDGKENFTADQKRKQNIGKNNKNNKKDKNSDIGGKIWEVIKDFIWATIKVALAIYVSQSYLQLTRSYKDGRMVPGLDPNACPYENVGCSSDAKKLSAKNYGFPYNMRDHNNPDSWTNVLINHFRDVWVNSRQTADWFIGVAEPATLISDTKIYKETDKDTWTMMTEFICIIWWIPFLLQWSVYIGAMFTPLWSSFKAFITHGFTSDFPWVTWNLIPLIFISPFGTFWNMMAIPMYLLWFLLARPWSMLSKGGIKTWCKQFIGKYYIAIFLWVLLGLFSSWNNHLQGTDLHKAGLIVIGVLGLFLGILAATGHVPARLPYLNDDGEPAAFRVPGEDKLNVFRYTKPASRKVK
tara:strand:- start:381 stop:1535 length:1155 start_codon:yes stop_codon:yes gene_type:complete